MVGQTKTMRHYSDLPDPQIGKLRPGLERLREWSSFLEMLSVEETERFMAELDLPIDRATYPKVVRLSRACLEVVMFPSLGKQNDPTWEFTWEFPQHWPKYRRQEGVLSDDALRKFAKKYQYLDEVIIEVFQGRMRCLWPASFFYVVPYAYTELKEWIGSETAGALEEWFGKYFRGPAHESSNWPLIIMHVFRNNSNNVAPIMPCPLDDEDWQAVKEFCVSYDERNHELSKRFGELREAAADCKPTPWEAVLQTFPVDSYAKSRLIPREIEYCLHLRVYLDEVGNLKRRLGDEKARQFANWAFHEARQPSPHGLKLWL